jgi:DNA polymerase III epsilon subunit-like protein
MELGFSRVIQLIMDSKKPLVGHNMMYDLGFIYRQFVSKDGSLPENFEDFTKAWRKCFPQKIFDTKVLAAFCGQDLFGKTSLDLVYAKCLKDKKLRNNVDIIFDSKTHELFGSYGQKNTTSN